MGECKTKWFPYFPYRHKKVQDAFQCDTLLIKRLKHVTRSNLKEKLLEAGHLKKRA